MARTGQRGTGQRRSVPRNQRRDRDRGDVIAVLAATMREIEAAARRGRMTHTTRGGRSIAN